MTLIGGLFFFYNFIQFTLFNPLAQALMEQFQLNEVAFGSINSAFFLAVALLALPAGMIADKFRTKPLLLALTLATVLNLVFTAFISNAALLGVLRFAQGMIHAFALTLPLKLATQWMAPKRMALASSLVVTIGLLGGALAQPMMTYFADTFGLHQALLVDALLGGMIFLLFALTLRDNDEFWQAHPAPRWLDYFSGLRFSLFNGQNWTGGAYVCLLNLPLILLGASWGQPYMEHVWVLPAETGSFVISLIFIGVIVGSPLMGFASDTLQSRKRPMVAGSLFSILVFLPVLLAPSMGTFMLALLFFFLGVGTSAQVLVYPMVAESNSPRYVGTSLSIVTLVIMAGNALANLIFSALLNSRSVQTAWGPEFTAGAFTPGIWMIWLGLAFSFLFIWMMRETFQ
jgi:MFS family permease